MKPNHMLVYKFGGASIRDADRFLNAARIIRETTTMRRVVIVSALGKTTNALETVVEAFMQNDTQLATARFEEIKNVHLELAKEMLSLKLEAAKEQLHTLFTEVEWLLYDRPVRSYDYYYDQIVSCGELLSSTLLYFLLLEHEVKVIWRDVRDLLRTDQKFRNAGIDWEFSERQIRDQLLPVLENMDVVITQGFIGCTDENESTTLGREGSDYTAAIFANMLDAQSVTIWKDVDAVMNADPKKHPDARPIKHLNFNEVIEMAYYGAQVIHPKTIKPIQNKKIPLLVKSFIDPSLPGTCIDDEPVQGLPPIIVNKSNQVLMRFNSLDFSFIEDQRIQDLHHWFSTYNINPNLSQKTAISLLCCFDDQEEKIHGLAAKASEQFDVQLEKNLELLTIRHYEEHRLTEILKNKQILLQQQTPDTIQVLMRQ
jgi:aspartate kinase